MPIEVGFLVGWRWNQVRHQEPPDGDYQVPEPGQQVLGVAAKFLVEVGFERQSPNRPR